MWSSEGNLRSAPVARFKFVWLQFDLKQIKFINSSLGLVGNDALAAGAFVERKTILVCAWRIRQIEIKN